MTESIETSGRASARRTLGLLSVFTPMVLVVGLAACGDDDGSFGTPDVTIGPTSYVTLPVASTAPSGTANGQQTAAGGTVAGTQDYEIESGDALFSIAQAFDVDYQDICSVNEWDTCESHALNPGDIIKIPPGGKTLAEVEEERAAQAEETTDETTEESDGESNTSSGDGEVCPDGSPQGTYKVVEGDIPSRVARKTDYTVEQLERANANNPVWNSFIIGGELLLPCSGGSDSTEGWPGDRPCPRRAVRLARRPAREHGG
jgi:LysM repeat protein